MKHKYITKMNYDRTVGWVVRVPEIKDGFIVPDGRQRNNKFFNKGKGTWKAALEKAIVWRDAYLKKHKAMHLLDKHQYRGKECIPYVNSWRNISGVIGVHLSARTKPSGVYYGYTSVSMDNGKQVNKSYACDKYGDIGAFQLACIFRYKAAGILIVSKSVVKDLPDSVEYKINDNL